MEQENKKIGFFSRVKIAVAKLEDYHIFLEEKTSVAVKYFFLIVLILSFVMAIVETYSIMRIVSKGYEYVQNELPDFSYEDGKLDFSEEVYGYDQQFDFYVMADTADKVTDEQLQEYQEQIKSMGIIFLKDKLIYKDGINKIDYSYDEISREIGITKFDRQTLIEKVESIGMTGITITVGLMILVGLYIIQILSTFLDWIAISIFAFISSRICRINIQFKQAFNISIYALTLSIILTMFYNIAYYLTDFYTDYFRMVYLLIAYVYVVASIFMMKSDFMKQQVEVTEQIESPKETQEKLEEKEEDETENKKTNENEDKPKEDSKDNDENEDAGEPDGSEI